MNTHLAKCLNRFLNVKAVVAAFNQEKALSGAFSSMIVKLQTSRRFVSSSTLRRSFLSLLVGEVAGLAVNQGGETIMGSCSVSTVSRAGDIWGRRHSTLKYEGLA